MCGIVGYVGKREAVGVLFDGLKRLEYRGYDSAGLAVDGGGKLIVCKSAGKLQRLALLLDQLKTGARFGIGHTRWATHGQPTTENAHPHLDCADRLAVVHNGIIENYHELKLRLVEEGHIFRSETDTETIVHLIERYYQGDNLKQAVVQALAQLQGSFAIAVMSASEPGRICAARRFSPLVVGLGEGEYYLASDTPAILAHTRDEILIDNGELVEMTADGVEVTDLTSGQRIDKPLAKITWSAEQAEKCGYAHYMLKEIYEQPSAVRETLLGRVSYLEDGPGAMGITDLDVRKIDTVQIVACGTSYHAGLAGKYLIEALAGIPVELELASEYRYRAVLYDRRTLLVAISQSGETADTLAAVEKARARGCPVLSICNVPGSNLTRLSDSCIYTKAGPEIGVASTKAFTTQLTALLLFALHCGEMRGQLAQKEMAALITALTRLPADIERTLQCEAAVEELARRYHQAATFLYLGRWLSYPVALEGALKMKEISYINALGLAAGEMKHGPIALIEQGMPVVVLAARNHVYEKVLSNIEEVRARGGDVIAIADADDAKIAQHVRHSVMLPHTHPMLTPVLQTVPLQLLAYHIALLRGCDVDQPRNLAKSVTVE